LTLAESESHEYKERDGEKETGWKGNERENYRPYYTQTE